MSLPRTLSVFTADQYLDLERHFEIRHEFLDGTVYAMSGGSPAHSAICFNLNTTLGVQLRGTSCKGFSSDMKVRAGDASLYAYPDLTVVCGEPRFHDDHGDVLLNPVVIFEVLSRSTEAYDRGEKSERYKTIETLTDYVLVSQDRALIEHFSRQPDGTWSLTEVDGLDASLGLASINCRLPLAEVYDRIEFAA
ncbi:MAG TPA: Uma2 family endonuclease [Pyrinomonadaceae bacterium]|jgi:Uma2 family endonuclease|nr:Uma2 family endonuclease [Pyrinomonadaceae bacterium]